MVLGRQGLKLEAWKFAVYLIVPIGASIAFNDPDVQKYWADYFQFLKYPANPNTNLKEQFEELQRQREKEKEQRKEYMDQLRRLQQSAQQSRREAQRQEEENQGRGWFRSR